MPRASTKTRPADRRDPDAVRFGAALKRAREARGLSYRAGAELLEVNLSQLQSLEAGTSSTTWPAVVRIAKRLGLSLDELAQL